MKKKHTNNDIVMIVIRAKIRRVWRNGKVRADHTGPYKPC